MATNLRWDTALAFTLENANKIESIHKIMNAEHAQSASDDPPSVEGEFVGKHYNGDPSETMEDLVQAMTRYMNENPKKTAIIVTAGVTAAITAALTAAVATTAIILIGDLADRWIGPKD